MMSENTNIPARRTDLGTFGAKIHWQRGTVELTVQKDLLLPVTLEVPAPVWLAITAQVLAGMAARMGQQAVATSAAAEVKS